MGSSGENMGSLPNLVNISQTLLKRSLLDESNDHDESNHTVATLFKEMYEKFFGYSSDILFGKGLLGYWAESKPITVINQKRRFDSCNWLAHSFVYRNVCAFLSGLTTTGLKEDEKVAIFASPCAKSFIALQACFRRKAPAVTLDTWVPLGEETLVHILNEAGVSTVVCDKSQAKRLMNVEYSLKLKTVKRIIYVAQDYSTQPLSFEAVPDPKIDVQSFHDVEKRGWSQEQHPLKEPHHAGPVFSSPADIALIIYTRATTTSSPQGVSITHRSLLTAVLKVSKFIPRLHYKDVFFASSPFPNILQLLVELYIALSGRGAGIGYPSRDPLMDASRLLRPTIVMTVPTALDQVKDSVRNTFDTRPGFSKKLFNLGYSRILKAMEGGRRGDLGLEGKFWNSVMFNKLRAELRLRNRLRWILLIGGPLSKDTQSFMKICFDIPIIPVDGLTQGLTGSAKIE